VKRVAFLTRDLYGEPTNFSPGGCAFYRCYLPMAVLQAKKASLGMPVYDPIRGYGVMENSKIGMYGFDTISLKLIMDRGTAQMMRLARNNVGQKFVIDIDDYYKGLTPANKAYELSNEETNKKANRVFYDEAIAEADLLTVSTPFLLEHHSKTHPNVRMIRNGVNPNMFDPVTQNTKPVIGWAGSTNFRNNDLEQLEEWLPDFLEEHDLMVHHAGHSDNSPAFHAVTGVNPDRVRTTPLTLITHYASGFRFDIGLVPLNDIEFNHAKSNIKGLEYAAAGIPFIASDTPEYRLLHEAGVGRIARTADDWRHNAEALMSLHTRRLEAKRIRHTVITDWSIDARKQEWRDAYSSLL